MPEKDLYEKLIKFYEFQLGEMPFRDEFYQALKATFSPQDLRVFFLLPFMGNSTSQKLEKKAAKTGIETATLEKTLKAFVPQGLVDTWIIPGKGRVYARALIISLLELQVRLVDDSPMRAACTKVMNAFIEGAVKMLPTRTPYYRVLPVERTLTGATPVVTIPLEIPIPDPREVLPIDIVSEMVKKEELIAVSDCYCRSTKRLIGEDCGHPMETCFYFNELAQTKLEAGYARRVDYKEAMRILYQAEEAGLIHNVSNCKGKIQTLCNCCSCSCGVIKAIVHGQTNVGAPSRYTAVVDTEKCQLQGNCVPACPMKVYELMDGKLVQHAEKCIGCGHCVSVCPEQAIRMELRSEQRKIYTDNDALFRQINIEGITGLVVSKLQGR